jgi:hypothetical protein
MSKADRYRGFGLGAAWLACGLALGCGVQEYEDKMTVRRAIMKEEVERDKVLGPKVTVKGFPQLCLRAPKSAQRLNPPPSTMLAAFQKASGSAPIVLYVVGEKTKKGGKLSGVDAFLAQVRTAVGSAPVVQDLVLMPKSRSVKITSRLVGQVRTRPATQYQGAGTLLIDSGDGATLAKSASFQIYVLTQGGVRVALVYGYDKSKFEQSKSLVKHSVGATWIGADAAVAKSGTRSPAPDKAADGKKAAGDKPRDKAPEPGSSTKSF